MTVIKINAVQVLALSCFGVAMGVWLKRKIPLLDQLNIPASIVGGLVYALVTLVLRDRVVNFDMDTSLQNILMVAFFTTIGMSASLRLVKQGGPQVLWFLGIASAGAVLQNIVGIAGAKLVGISPLLGIIGGSVALTGGPATALSFGRTFEGAPYFVAGATTLGVAAAMFGITAGGLLGGFIGGQFIRRNKLSPAPVKTGKTAEGIIYAGDPDGEPPPRTSDESESEEAPLLRNVLVIAIAMGLGTLISIPFERAGIVLPIYIGAMIAAAVIRNIDDRFGTFRISQHQVDEIGNVALYIFIVMALLTLRLWELVHLAVPMLVLLLLQIALVAFMCYATFRLMGRDYDAAVMSGGFCGFMLGTTANAMACMSVLRDKYGPAPRAFIVVPLVGASLIDFVNSLVIVQMANLVR